MSSCKLLPSAWCYQESWFRREMAMTLGLVLESLLRKEGIKKKEQKKVTKCFVFEVGVLNLEGVVPEYASEMQTINMPKESFYGHTTFIVNQ